jgi:hAT family C-terminal dimerisation region
MYKATVLLSSTTLPTQGDLRLTFLGMMASLQQYQQQSDVANAIYNKLKSYWVQYLSRSSAISAILDPRYKLSTFSDPEEREECVDYLQTLYSSYIQNSHTIPNRINEEMQDSRSYFLNIINSNQSNSFGNNLGFKEIDNYLNMPNDINIDPLSWWKVHQKEYPILSLMAKDFLIIQSTSVPSEQAFSIANNTITQTRNRLDPETAREILCLKSWIENKLGINTNNEEISNFNSNDNDYDSDYSNYSDYRDSNNNNFNSSDTSSNSDDTSSSSDYNSSSSDYNSSSEN